MPTSRLVPGRYPPPGTSPIADRIRQRRSTRSLTPLDGALLHVPPVAEGWNSLFGAIRTKGNLPGDVRELITLRVAARNHAALEWIHHERTGRSHGLTTEQLYIIRNTSAPIPLPDNPGVLSTLQAAALAFAEESTVNVKVKPAVADRLMKELGGVADILSSDEPQKSKEDKTQDLLVEATAVVASYNMVSRFLVALDIAGMADNPVPWPAERLEHNIPIPSYPAHTLHAVTLTTHPSAPWIVLSNSLLTNYTLWDSLLPYLLAPQPSSSKSLNSALPNTYNVLLFDQRGHGLSLFSPSSSPSSRVVTIPILASDIALIITTLKIQKVHAVIGVSQGGAAALAFGAMYPDKVGKIISCDTSASTPAGNKEAWEERIALVKEQGEEGMEELAKVTVARWFPDTKGSVVDDEGRQRKEKARERMTELIKGTSVEGFEAGARALQDYDLLSPQSGEGQSGGGLLQSNVPTLLVAGNLDGGGKVAEGMKDLAKKWNTERAKVSGTSSVEFAEIEGAGHLPMVDETAQFWEIISKFLGA